MIEIFLEAPLELRVLLLFGIVMLLSEFIKQLFKEDNNAKKGHKQ